LVKEGFKVGRRKLGKKKAFLIPLRKGFGPNGVWWVGFGRDLLTNSLGIYLKGLELG